MLCTCYFQTLKERRGNKEQVLIGGLEQFLFSIYWGIIWNVIIPTDFDSIIFQRDGEKPPTRKALSFTESWDTMVPLVKLVISKSLMYCDGTRCLSLLKVQSQLDVVHVFPLFSICFPTIVATCPKFGHSLVHLHAFFGAGTSFALVRTLWIRTRGDSGLPRLPRLPQVAVPWYPPKIVKTLLEYWITEYPLVN